MGQVGLHALTGLVVGERLLMAYAPDRKARRALMFGFVMGNIAPDLDYTAMVGLYPVNQALALHMHRSFSHSLLAAVALAFGLGTAAALMRDRYLRSFAWGLSLGVVAHFTMDIFLWFAPVDIFWPASVYGIIPPVDIWSWWEPPPFLPQLMSAAEYAALALYYTGLLRLARRLHTNPEMVRPLRRMAVTCWVVWAIASALILDLPGHLLELIHYVPLGLIFLPACYYLTWRMRSTIEVLGAPEHRETSSQS